FLSRKGGGGGRGVREKNRNRVLNNEAAKDGVVPFATVASGNNNVTQDENVGQCSSIVASNKVTGEPRRNVSPTTRKSVNFCTLITPAGNETDVVVSLESIRAISERSSYARAMIELRADVELKDTIVVAMPKLVGEWLYMCTIRVEYEWKPPRCSSCKVFGHVLNECPKKIITDVVKNLNNPRQTTRGVSVGPKNLLLPTGNADSKSKVEAVFDDTENLMGPTCFKGESDIGYSTNSMWEPWKETKRDDDYDPYDDDLYETHDMPYQLQAICDDLYITVHGQKKK
nr:hypothetical protein [Tanacetum cinerariifolium]